MSVKRVPIMVRKSGGRDAYNQPMHIDRETFVDIPVKPAVPDGTPRFACIRDNPAVQEAERRWKHLLENKPKTETAVDDAHRNYQQTLDTFAMGRATMEQVEEAQALHAKATAMRDAV